MVNKFIKKNMTLLVVLIVILFCSTVLVVFLNVDFNSRNSPNKISENNKLEIVANPVIEGKIPNSVLEKDLPELDKTEEVSRADSNEKELTDSELSYLWYQIREEQMTESEVKSSVDSLVQGIKGLLQDGKTPSIVGAFEAVMLDETEYGFNQLYYPYPNGSVQVIVMVLPKGLVEDRVVVYTVVDVEGKINVGIFNNLNFYPINFALETEGGNYILMSGSKVNGKMFTGAEEQGFVAVSVGMEEMKVIELEVENDINNVGWKVDNNVLRMVANVEEDGIYSYVDVVGDGRITSNINFITSDDETMRVYTFQVEGGKAMVRFERFIDF